MSSGSEPEFTDYITDEAQTEEGSLFLPAPEPSSDPWMRLILGIMAGLGGAALVSISPKLATVLISIGYSVAAFGLRGRGSDFGSALCLGFTITALLGAALLVVELAAPLAAQHLIQEVGKRHLILPGFALLPWALAVLKYVYAVFRPFFKQQRRNGGGVSPAPGAPAARNARA